MVVRRWDERRYSCICTISNMSSFTYFVEFLSFCHSVFVVFVDYHSPSMRVVNQRVSMLAGSLNSVVCTVACLSSFC